MGLDNEKLLKLYPQYDSILGPYERPDGRKHIILNNSTVSRRTKGKLKTISYPKALVESNIGRRLLPNETVDHDDRDKRNDSPDNLIIRDRSIHTSLDVLRVEYQPIPCLQCGKILIPSKGQVASRNANRAGPFCSRDCIRIYSANVRNGGLKLARTEIEKVYCREGKYDKYGCGQTGKCTGLKIHR